MISYSEAEQLIIAAQQGDNEACEKLLRENSGLIWSITRRYMGRGVDTDDLYQLGCVGFLKAVRSFDTEYGTRFSTYAVPKIAGEIRRFLRDDGPVKVSRTIKERAASIRAADAHLSGTLGREPTLSELSEKTGYSAEEIAVAETATAATESLQKETGEDGFTLESVLGECGMEDEIVERLTIRNAVLSLDEKERLVINLRYYHGLTQEKAAKVLGVSQVQISRLERRAVKILRELLGDS